MDKKSDILKYLPSVIQDLKEFKNIAEVENPEIDLVSKAIEDVMNNQFVNDSTENGVKRWESILKIYPKGSDSLDVRKFRIIARLNEQLPYTMTTLENQLLNLCGKDGYYVELKNNEYILSVKINLVAKKKFEEVDELLKRVVPANLVIDLKIMYNQHIFLKKFTHGQLKLFTHDKLRNEVLI